MIGFLDELLLEAKVEGLLSSGAGICIVIPKALDSIHIRNHDAFSPCNTEKVAE